MRPQQQEREIAVGGSTAGATFGISKTDEAHIMGILRDLMYFDKVYAVLREYAANAWDANRAAGRPTTPVEVHLPTEEDPYLRIRDRGPGLSRADVLEVYTQYGASTKRGTNDAVGMLGIGSKSGFAYADTFTVTSWYPEHYDDDFVGPRCGSKSIYVAALDPSDRGVLNLVHEEACDPADTGIEVTVAVKEEDHDEFTRKARTLFRHFDPRPVINAELPAVPDERVALASGSIDYTSADGYGTGEWVAVMGCVPYRIRLAELGLAEEHRCLHKMAGTLKFEIGDVQISASREELRYTAKTKAALVEKFTSLVDEYIGKALDILDSDAETWWQKRLRVRVLKELDLDLPEQYEDLGKSWVKLFDSTDLVVSDDGKEVGSGGPFGLVRNGAATNQVTVDASLRFLVDDTGKKLAGYRFAHNDYVVRGKGAKWAPDEASVKALEDLLTATLAASRLTGAKVERLSTLTWTQPYVKPSRSSANRAKHKATMFRLVTGSYYHKPYSDHWEVVTRVPEATDVYVVLDHFEAGDFYSCYREDKRLAEALDAGELPAVYGYKTTEKKPVDRSKLVGTEYSTWRRTWAQGLMTPERAAIAQACYWDGIGGSGSARRVDLNEVVKALGRKHPISQLIAKSRSAHHRLRKVSQATYISLAERCGITAETSDAEKAHAEVVERYPLIKLTDGQLANLWTYGWRKDRDVRLTAWAQYIKLVDSSMLIRLTPNE